MKIIKLGMDTKQVVARFEAERQALAMMEHPNIAKVFDAGATDTGRPYFTMELIRGVPITEYCDESRLTTRRRLELFIQICQAVQHAHQKGIIHRDIKPSNVLVTPQGDVPVTKIIDFGIAKATHQSLTNKTIFTGFRQFVGTPEYVSPEQAEMGGLDIDTRSDIYSLGVLLYELLTGMPPFDPNVFRTATYAEIREIICDRNPITPSRRVTSSGNDLTKVSRNRQIEPHSLHKLLRGDLDWIVMKAMEKDRDRRYGTAAALADDIQRHLDDVPISACPPGAIYQLRKTFARHKAMFGFAGTLFTVVVGFGIWMGFLYAEANLLRRQAERERGVAQKNSRRAEEAEEQAKREAKTTRKVAESLAGLFELADPIEARGGGVTAREILDRGAERVREELKDQPLTQASLMDRIGQVYTNLGLYTQAIPLLQDSLSIRREQLGGAHVDMLATMNRLGKALMFDGKPNEAEPLLRQAMKTGRSVLGDVHSETLTSVRCLAWTLQSLNQLPEAELLFREVFETNRRIVGIEDSETLGVMSELSWLLEWMGDFEEAEALSREAVEVSLRVLGDDHVITADSATVLGLLMLYRNKVTEAEPLLRQALTIRLNIFGEDHIEVLASRAYLGSLSWLLGRLEDAETAYRTTLAGYRRIRGDSHPGTLRFMVDLGDLLLDRGKLDEAEALLREAQTGLQREVGGDHRYTLLSMTRLGRAMTLQEHPDEAEPLLREALDALRKLRGCQHPNTLEAIHHLSRALIWQDKLAEAEALLRESASYLPDPSEFHSARMLGTLNFLGVVLERQCRLDEAEKVLRDAIAAGRNTLPEDNYQIATPKMLLGRCLIRLGSYEEAESLLLESYAVLSDALGDGDERTRGAIQGLAELYEDWGMTDQASTWRAKLAIEHDR